MLRLEIVKERGQSHLRESDFAPPPPFSVFCSNNIHCDYFSQNRKANTVA